MAAIKLLQIKFRNYKQFYWNKMVDVLNWATLIDIKPFFAKFDIRTNTIFGLLDNQEIFLVKNFILMNVINYNTYDK
jgi:tRNA (Thr-GGU) A37 N-methylase